MQTWRSPRTGSSSDPSYQPITLVDLLRRRAYTNPDLAAYTFVTDTGSEVGLTYSELDRKARAIATLLQTARVTGSRALLLYPPGLEFIAGFFGCLYAGVTAVPAYPPDPARLSRSLPRLQAVIADAETSTALTTASLLSYAENTLTQSLPLGTLRWVSTDTIADSEAGGWVEPSLNGDALAFIQYTSGSTGAPRGVMLSHRNLLHNASLVYEAFEHAPNDKYVSWLPTFHDMGFMAGVLQPLYAGFQVVLISPVSFLQNPIIWLETISRTRASTGGGPNFAYELCVRKIKPEQRATLDLSSWTVAFNGSEPIRPETIERFITTFEPCGFRPEAFYPCYGLAEGTLIVSGGFKNVGPVFKEVRASSLEKNLVEPATPNDHKRVLVGCGRALSDETILIVDPVSSTRCGPDRVGEIWISSPSVAQGYWNRPELTRETFRAQLAGGGKVDFLRTGDLGFISEGELFVTGRLKDLIIIRGLNHYPQDIELTVEQCHMGVRPGCGAAFSIDADSGERLVIVQEIDSRGTTEPSALMEEIRKNLALDHELQPYAISLIKSGSIPKTSSGKIQRRACRAAFLANKLNLISQWRAPSEEADEATMPGLPPTARTLKEIEQLFVSRVAVKLGIDPLSIDVDQPISGYGLDSLTVVELAHEIETEFGTAVSISDLLHDMSISSLATQVLRQPRPVENTAWRISNLSPDAATEHHLSSGQQALWFLHQLVPESAAYNIAAAVSIDGELNIAVLKECFQALVDRHDCLRATFSANQGDPVQRISASAEICFRQEEASSWNEQAIRARLIEESHRPFDLEQGPLLRVTVLTSSDRKNILLLVVHHIVADFWSLGVLTHELGILYRSASDGVSPALPPLTARYSDYVNWQTELLRGPKGERLWEYWLKQIGGDLPALNLPADYHRKQGVDYAGASESFKLGGELTRRLEEYGRSRGATLYMVLLAAFQVLLYRHSGQEVIAIGSPSSGRSLADFAPIVGYFVNPVVMRADIVPELTFDEHLSRVRQSVLGALEHQDYPFMRLVERLQPERDSTRSPIFQVMFVFQQAPSFSDESMAALALGEAGATMDLGGLQLTSLSLEKKVAQFDLTLMMAEVKGEIAASLQYNQGLFKEGRMKRMGEQLRVVLEGVASGEDERVGWMEVLPEEERELLKKWNETEREYPGGGGLHELFEEQARMSPEQEAVVCGVKRMTYGELDKKAGELAGHLRRLGVGREVLVGICMKRTTEMIVGMLGVLKAGGGYVPVEPGYPGERIEETFKDAGVGVVISDRESRAQVEGRCEKVVCMEEWEEEREEVGEERRERVDGRNVAYVMYTSGSTGRPKGVVIEHGSAVTLMNWIREEYSQRELGGVLASTSICFDLSVFEIFGALSWGGKVILAENVLELRELRGREEVRLINTVPSAMGELVREGELGEGVEVVNLAGEALHHSLVEEVYEKGNVRRVMNLYGPTEDTTYSTYAEMKRGGSGSASIGRGVANTKVYVVDGRGKEVPVGVAGELCIGGEGLARGYLKRGDQTAERFVPEPYSGEGGARMYRTGDLCRYTEEGELEYLGRRDQQVKVRGYRIEMGEIESVMKEEEWVKEAVVEVREREGVKMLVGWVAIEEGSGKSVEEVKRRLRERVPEYMVPGVMIRVEEVPLTGNGKVDRGALRKREIGEEAGAVRRQEPAEGAEAVIAGIWEEVLGRRQVGVSENFFEIGGHSLLATRVMSRLQEVFKIQIPLRTLFEAPTVAGLSEKLQFLMTEGRGLRFKEINRSDRSGELPLSFAQQRLWFLQQLDPGSAAYNIGVATRLRGPLSVPALEQCLNEIINRHEALRTSLTETKGVPAQIVRPGSLRRLPLIDLDGVSLVEREREARRLAREEIETPFDLTGDELLRLTLLRLAEKDHVLLLTMHHIISDGWSVGVIARELEALYPAYSEGKPAPLPELPVQYGDFVVWQQESLQGEVLEEQLTFWKNQLGDGVWPLELPTDRARPAVQSFRGESQTIYLDESLTRALKILSHRASATLFMTLLAGFKVLLYRYCGQNEILVGTPVAGRTRAELEPLIGFFVNTLVLRSDLSDDPGFVTLLGRVREAALGAYAHQEFPFEKLVEALQLERDLSRSPIFQVWFNLTNFSDEQFDLKLPELTVENFYTESVMSKFDLTVYAEQKGESIKLDLVYSTDLFDADTMTEMLGQYEKVLESVVRDPNARVSTVGVEESERRLETIAQMIEPSEEFKEMDEESTNQTIGARFEEQACRYRERVAIATGEGEISYGELKERTNRIARQIRGEGARGRGQVALLLSHGAGAIAGIMGALKAGKTYVPLDGTYPRQRLKRMLEDSESTMIVTDEANRELAEELSGGRVGVIDIDSEEREEREEEEDREEAEAGDIAYILYTSGSTGEPKGVMQSHRNVLRHIRNYTNVYRISKEDRLTQVSSYGFDGAVMDIMGGLLNGASLHPVNVREEGVRRVVEVIERERVTIYHSTPTVFRYVMSSLRGGEDLSSVRVVVMGGEEVYRKDWEQYRKHFSDECVFANGLGPSESTTGLIYMANKKSRIRGDSVPVGYAVEGAEVRLMDEKGRQAAARGEIAIVSEEVALGYWKKGKETSEAFKEEEGGNGRRMYLTGDLGRRRMDGSIEYLGRKDRQVKVRGYRVELGEIEAAMEEQEWVKEAVVVAREDERGEKRLIGYVVEEEGKEVSEEEVRRRVREKLPEYMVPVTVMKIREAPLTPNGKIDHRALPEPPISRSNPEQSLVAPRTESERALATIWREVLNTDQVGVTDNFFALGGHSLMVMLVVSRIREEWKIELPLRTFFEAPTVEGLAGVLSRMQLEPDVASVGSITRIDRDNQSVLQRLDELSESEMDSLLSELVNSEEVNE